MRKLSAFTNVIPLIAKADSLSPEDVQALKHRIRDELNAAEIRPFLFNPDKCRMPPPYTVCSISANDDENMDASLLMSPDYVQPLLPSELTTLVHQIFHEEAIPWLRYLAARKIVDSRRKAASLSMQAYFSQAPLRSHPLHSQFSTEPASLFSPPSSSRVMVSHTNTGNSYLQAMTADRTQREEKYAQIRLAKWAGDLQRCLQNERTRYEALARGERAVWLTERLGECVKDGSLVPVDEASTMNTSQQAGTPSRTGRACPSSSHSVLNPRDPLGLIRWGQILTRRGWIAFQVVGSFGILGAMAIWMTRRWGAGADTYSSWSCAFWDGNYRCLAQS